MAAATRRQVQGKLGRQVGGRDRVFMILGDGNRVLSRMCKPNFLDFVCLCTSIEANSILPAHILILNATTIQKECSESPRPKSII